MVSIYWPYCRRLLDGLINFRVSNLLTLLRYTKQIIRQNNTDVKAIVEQE